MYHWSPYNQQGQTTPDAKLPKINDFSIRYTLTILLKSIYLYFKTLATIS